MSVQPTNSTKYLEFHGIKLAGGAQIANLVVEKLTAVPATLEAGRFWYNTTSNQFQIVKHDGSELVVESFSTATELAGIVNEFKSDLASNEAGKGTGLVGFSGQAGANSKYSVVAGTTEDTLKSLVLAIDAEIKDREDADTSAADALADSTGATLVGYEGKAGTNGKITVDAGTVKAGLDSIVEQVDAQFSSLGDDALSKTKTADQSVASKVTFGSDVVIEGDINVLGERFIIEGNVVELGDNIILLNRDVLPDADPVADAGLEVNRGNKGILSFITWDESEKEVTVPVVTIADVADAENGIEVGDEIIVQSRVIDGVEFDKYANEADGRLDTLEDQVNGKIGDLTILATEDKSTIVASVNELHSDAQTDRDNLAATTGSGLVGYAGKVGANSLVTVAEGTVAKAVDSLVVALDAEMKATDDFIADVVATEVGKGASLVGFTGQGEVGTDKFAVPAGSVTGTLQSVITAINEDREAIEALENANDGLKTAINAQSYKVVSSAKLTHTIVHNLGSQDIDVTTWFKDGSVWVNHQAYTVIVDDNIVELTLTTAAEVKVLVKKFEDLV